MSNIKVHFKSRQTSVGQRGRRVLAQTLVQALGVPAVGALTLLLLLFGAELLPVGLAVLVDQSDLRWERGGDQGGLWVRSGVVRLWLLVFVLISQGQNNVSVQDAQRHADHGVFEVVFSGQAVVEACV